MDLSAQQAASGTVTSSQEVQRYIVFQNPRIFVAHRTYKPRVPGHSSEDGFCFWPRINIVYFAACEPLLHIALGRRDRFCRLAARVPRVQVALLALLARAEIERAGMLGLAGWSEEFNFNQI